MRPGPSDVWCSPWRFGHGFGSLFGSSFGSAFGSAFGSLLGPRWRHDVGRHPVWPHGAGVRRSGGSPCGALATGALAAVRWAHGRLWRLCAWAHGRLGQLCAGHMGDWGSCALGTWATGAAVRWAHGRLGQLCAGHMGDWGGWAAGCWWGGCALTGAAVCCGVVSGCRGVCFVVNLLGLKVLVAVAIGRGVGWFGWALGATMSQAHATLVSWMGRML
ncbi:hypothetical protein FB389_1560 [Rarobacter incanus]|uniref:Uncharacterized protein n=1 Tax=Rarobacter incanus TaxID=153494 RepID=A0A542SQJ5_9MICO|nr:hypothetical protein FB389_1560 [Rarobacter incanus]